MGMSKDRCPYNSFFGEKVMIKEKLSLIWGKFVNRETISYLIFGVLTTLVDWISYAVFRHNGMNYRMATICCQAAAILFAYVTNRSGYSEATISALYIFLRKWLRFSPAVFSHRCSRMWR